MQITIAKLEGRHECDFCKNLRDDVIHVEFQNANFLGEDRQHVVWDVCPKCPEHDLILLQTIKNLSSLTD